MYAAKTTKERAAMLSELRSPVRLSFFPTISISLVLLSIGTMHDATALSEALWIIGGVAHLGFTLFIMQIWLHESRFETGHMNPAWFIPVVGNILMPVAGVTHGYIEISWFFFAIGFLFWLVLLAIVFYRMIFHAPLPNRLLPTMFILIAPPAVGFIAYMRLTGSLDPFSRILYYSALFLTLLLLTQAHRFARLEFYLSWWAYSFPMAAITIATMVMFEKTGETFFSTLGYVLLAVVSVLVAFLVIRTARAIAGKEICVEEG
jgi:tellurite resistance protein